MRILQVVSSMNPDTGGVCQGIRNTLPALRSLDCESDVVCLDDQDVTYQMDDEFSVIRLGDRRGPWSYSRRLSRWLDQALPRYDAVVTNGLWLYQSHAVTQAIARLKRTSPHRVPRSYVMPHGMLDPYFQKDPSRQLKAYRNWMYWKVIEHRVISQADGVLFTCQRELELARRTFRPYKPKREINIGYGVPKPPAYQDAMQAAFHDACPIPQQRPYLLFLSRIHPKKGVDLLLRSYAEFAASENHQPIPALVIAGPLDSPYADQMQSLADELGLLQGQDSDQCNHGTVYFPGMLRSDAKWGAFYGCDAFVLPSHQENFGVAVAEALACSKPVLISDQVNICDEISAECAGIVEPDHFNGTLDLLQRWHQWDTNNRDNAGSAARHCYEKYFLPQRAANALVDALRADCESELVSLN